MLPSWAGSLVYWCVANLTSSLREFFRVSRVPDEAFLVEVDLDGVNSGEENVETEVELASVDQQRVVDVLLHAHLALLVRYLL